jgi:HAD domain in Swiss Army Knife RNA repair proteins
VTLRPVVLLDVDGVLNLARFRSSRQRSALLRNGEGWFHRKPRDPFSDDRLLVCLPRVRAAVHALLEAGAELAWATTWGRAANDYFVPLLGLPRVLPVAPVNFELSAKAYTVIPWLEGRPWAWLEDQERELAVAEAMTGRGVSRCPVLVSRDTGLTGEHAEAVRTWLRNL